MHASFDCHTVDHDAAGVHFDAARQCIERRWQCFDRYQEQFSGRRGQLDLGVAARLAGISLEKIQRLNPAFIRQTIHRDGPHMLLLPKARANDACQASWLLNLTWAISPGGRYRNGFICVPSLTTSPRNRMNHCPGCAISAAR